MRGFVLTPEHVVDEMVVKLFADGLPSPSATILDPGCGPGAFIDGMIRYAKRHAIPLPKILGVDSDPRHVLRARRRFRQFPSIQIREADFLSSPLGVFDYIIGNPPYVPITGLTEEERSDFRARFSSARGRFDLYLLFFEQALRQLRPAARLVFITPEKFIYVDSARPFRSLVRRMEVNELHLLDENTFPGLVTYPVVTTIVACEPRAASKVILRTGCRREVTLPQNGDSWQSHILGRQAATPDLTLADVAARISCGVATGADSVFVYRAADIPPTLRPFAFPTIAGRQLTDRLVSGPSHRMLVPYRRDGSLLAERELGALGAFLADPARRQILDSRTCAARKPWYAFHETPQLQWMLRPKILCKDISPEPRFLLDMEGGLVPRHSVYYIIPRDGVVLEALLAYLNSGPAVEWLADHCQRAANGYVRLQSAILKRLPVPRSFLPKEVSGIRPSRRTA